MGCIAQAQETQVSLIDSSLFDARLKPFYHGVASGDPLQERVIIWTRVSPDSMMEEITGTWQIATDPELQNIVNDGTFTTNAERDYTVKIDVEGLSPNTTYYYGFEALGRSSLTGRTKTAPEADEADHLRFAVVSCNNYEAGYFNAFGRIADRNDLDAVIHMGDYIYEYPTNVYGDTLLVDRRHPNFEAVMLDQYRTFYSLYRLDNNFRRVHQQLPFITVYDDHETANDAYVDGAENHQPDTEGDWDQRRASALQAYYEWLPIREQADSSIFRTLNYGNIADLIMLDTRLEGRDRQAISLSDSTLLDPARTLLGEEQLTWLLDNLTNSDAKWKVVGTQVMFSEFHVGWAGPLQGASFEEIESIFLDIWDGYPLERLQIINTLRDSAIDNTIFISGDFHASFAYDVADTVVNPADGYALVPNYDPETGDGAVAVEFLTPSITSANFDENLDQTSSDQLENIINSGEPILLQLNNPNPHMKYVDLDRHGYYVLDLKSDSAQANYYYVERIDEPSEVEAFGAGLYTMDGGNHLITATAESTPKEMQPEPAPIDPPGLPTDAGELIRDRALIIGVYPNPVDSYMTMQYAINQPVDLEIGLYDLSGKLAGSILSERHAPGKYQLSVNTQKYPSGIYLMRMAAGEQVITRKIVIR